jgi:hypothetical protein
MPTCKSDEVKRQGRPFRELVARFLHDVSSLSAACMHTNLTAMIRRRLAKAHVVLTTPPERRPCIEFDSHVRRLWSHQLVQVDESRQNLNQSSS